MKTRYKYIRFEKIDSPPSTKDWKVMSKNGAMLLGDIVFYETWSEFCFAPANMTVFSVDCLQDIIHFIGQLEKKEI